jgi:GT2 family glycosyltransferase
MPVELSVIIPNRDGAATLERCLAAACVPDDGVEVIVVDDGSRDESVAIIGHFPCRLVRLDRHAGAAAARNAGAAVARGAMLFFTDADCVLEPDTLWRVRQALAGAGPDAAVGGSYTLEPYDKRFFSRFQSAFIRYSELKRPAAPDYIASHALAISAETFRASGGFASGGLPILEDVEFSHRLRGRGVRLVMDPALQVRHIFDYSLRRSLANALRKSRYWVRYSLGNRDLLADSGTASIELKFNVAAFFLGAAALAGASLGYGAGLYAAAALAAANLFISRGLLRTFREAGGRRFALGAALYYVAVYPLPIGAGTVAGLAAHLRRSAGP